MSYKYIMALLEKMLNEYNKNELKERILVIRNKRKIGLIGSHVVHTNKCRHSNISLYLGI